MTPPDARTLTLTDPLDLPWLTLDGALAGNRTGVHVPDPGDRRFVRRGPAFVDNPHGVPGFDALGDAPVRYPPVFLVAAPRAVQIGYRAVVTADDRLLVDDGLSQAELAALGQRLGHREDGFLNEDTGLRSGPATDRLVLLPPDRPERRLEGRAVSLCSLEPANYGSFLFRILPKVQTLRRLGLTQEPVLVYPQSAAGMELLAMAGIAPDRLVAQDTHDRWRADLVLMPSMRNNQALLDPETLALAAELRERHGAAVRPGRRLYVSRRSYHAGRPGLREMVNEAELETALAALGFEIVAPERRSASEQVALFSSAEMVVGPSGSAMFNAMWCRPGTRLLDIESEPHWLHAHCCLFGSLGLDYGIAVGVPDPHDPASVHKRWRADVPAVVDRVSRLIRDG